MTDDSLSQANNLPIVPTDQINYMRNAVKATVDAYDGTVRLYAWDEDDPMLKAWRERVPRHRPPQGPDPRGADRATCATPRTCSRCSATSSQRYHVTDPGASTRATPLGGAEGPERPTKLQPPYRLFVEPRTGGGELRR